MTKYKYFLCELKNPEIIWNRDDSRDQKKLSKKRWYLRWFLKI